MSGLSEMNTLELLDIIRDSFKLAKTLSEENDNLRAENEALKTVAKFIIEYRSKNTRNFQLEKMDDFIRMLKELVQ